VANYILTIKKLFRELPENGQDEAGGELIFSFRYREGQIRPSNKAQDALL
jgi:hypothetical protein